MTSLVLASVLIMLGCFVVGALIAWLLAVALYPTRRDLGSPRATRSGGRR